MDDVDPNIDESLVEYELSKMDRMAKTVRIHNPAPICETWLNHTRIEA